MHGYPTHSIIPVLINRNGRPHTPHQSSAASNIAVSSEADPVHGCSRHLTSFPSLDQIESESTRAQTATSITLGTTGVEHSI